MERPDPSAIPLSSGVYLYKDEKGEVLYVGKARVLRRRVLSYFRKDGLSNKTRAMLSHAHSISYLSTTTEKEALLLEASLIKKYRPHYNIALRDDKQYFLFRLDKKALYPRLEIVRHVRRDGARYFGPFTSAVAARDTWKLLHKTFGLRRCTDRAMKNRIRPCLYYHMHECSAPCLQKIDEARYKKAIEQICDLLDGHADTLLLSLHASMEKASEELRYEEASRYRDQIRAIERTIEQQAVILPGKMDTDAISLFEGDKGMALAILFVRAGSISDGRNFYWPNLRFEDASELLLAFLSQYYATALPPPRILLPFTPNDRSENGAKDIPVWSTERLDFEDLLSFLKDRRQARVSIMTAQNTLDNQLIDVARTNAREEARRQESKEKENDLPLLARHLHLDHIPRRIECVDVSHTQGKQVRVGMTVFLDGSPLLSDYRTYSMEDSNDDYATLAAWIPKRLASGPPWPDLLLIDGGRGQVSSVQQSLSKEGMPDLFPVAGISKARDETGKADRRKGNVSDKIYVANRTNPLPLREGSKELLLLQKIRDATHAYAIHRHHVAQKNTLLSSRLTSLNGIGSKTARLLWDAFGSIQAMKQASIEDLVKLSGIGKSRAENILEKLKRIPDE